MVYNVHAFPQWEETTPGFQRCSACVHLSSTAHTYVILATPRTVIPASAPGCLSCPTLDSYLECVIFALQTFTVRMIILRPPQGDWRGKGLCLRQTLFHRKCLMSVSYAGPDRICSQCPACFLAQTGSQSTLVCKHLLIEMSTY